MAEAVKRLTPKSETLRELYLKSGNQCAFPDCEHLMMDKDGIFIGQICHIEAAEDGGERFNMKMSNEDRRSIENLMLMCYPHHQKTNDVKTYSVAILKKMKAAHEAKFTDIVEKMQKSIQDHTKKYTPEVPQTLAKMKAVVKWGFKQSEEAQLVPMLNELIQRFRKLPIRPRQLFEVILDRADWATHRDGLSASYEEVRQACDLKKMEFNQFLFILDKFELISVDFDESYAPDIDVRWVFNGVDWNFWADLKHFCDETKIPLSEFVIQLRFSLLD